MWERLEHTLQLSASKILLDGSFVVIVGFGHIKHEFAFFIGEGSNILVEFLRSQFLGFVRLPIESIVGSNKCSLIVAWVSCTKVLYICGSLLWAFMGDMSRLLAIETKSFA